MKTSPSPDSSAIRQHHQLRRKWINLLAYLGLDAESLAKGTAKPDAVLAVLESQQFAAEVIAEVMRLFFPDPDGGPGGFRPETSITREARVEILRQRISKGHPYHHAEDIVRGMLDDHVAHEPEGKKLVSWYDAEMLAEAEEETAANLDYLDEIPRERLKRWTEKRSSPKRDAMDSLRGLALAN